MPSTDRSLLWGFVGVHTLLIGLFPFYLSVYLWEMGYHLSELSWFVVVVGLGFLLAMLVWDFLRIRVSGGVLLALSLVFELMMVMLVWGQELLGMGLSWMTFLLLLGLLNGLYDGFFWITQRVIFLETVPAGGAGRSFGNLQVLVFLMLKLGIFLGGLLLESGGLAFIVAASWLVSVVALVLFVKDKGCFPSLMKSHPRVALLKSRQVYPDKGTEVVFLADGVFLYLESFFWLISLYQMATQSFLRLGLVVIGLALFFTLGFWVLKNTIDHFSLQRTYRLAVGIYVLSWVLQAVAVSLDSLFWLGITLLCLSFCTSFFRLTFNKRFFDIAHRGDGLRYILAKSTSSQLGMVVFFTIFALLSQHAQDMNLWLQGLYLTAAALTPLYLLYQIPQKS